MTYGEAEKLVSDLDGFKDGYKLIAIHQFWGSKVPVRNRGTEVMCSGNPGSIRQAINNGWI